VSWWRLFDKTFLTDCNGFKLGRFIQPDCVLVYRRMDANV